MFLSEKLKDLYHSDVCCVTNLGLQDNFSIGNFEGVYLTDIEESLFSQIDDILKRVFSDTAKGSQYQSFDDWIYDCTRDGQVIFVSGIGWHDDDGVSFINSKRILIPLMVGDGADYYLEEKIGSSTDSNKIIKRKRKFILGKPLVFNESDKHSVSKEFNGKGYNHDFVMLLTLPHP